MKISIIPRAGLCNRMRAISSGIFIAKKLMADSVIYWNWEDGLQANFNDLFLPIDEKISTVIENRSWRYNQYKGGGKSRVIRFFQSLFFDQFIYGHNVNTNGDIFSKIRTSGSLCLCSCHSMAQHYPMNQLFHPQPDIQQRIDKITACFNNNTIGIHIRRTDHAKAIALSPITKFYDIIAKEISLNKNVNFYLATDDNKVKQELVTTFGDRIITCDDKVERNSIDGMKFAVVDLYCLSKTSKIIGSAASSYSEIAAEIGEIELSFVS